MAEDGAACNEALHHGPLHARALERRRLHERPPGLERLVAPACAGPCFRGARLRALALVPFNTRLLADLVTDGLDPTTLTQLTTQVQLLDLYWRYRVTKWVE